jgi:hypothetical protein
MSGYPHLVVTQLPGMCPPGGIDQSWELNGNNCPLTSTISKMRLVKVEINSPIPLSLAFCGLYFWAGFYSRDLVLDVLSVLC